MYFWTAVIVQKNYKMVVQMIRPWQLQIELNFHCEKPLFLQITDAIINAIKSGKLKQGEALPGSRQLAEQLKVNRNTIVNALDVLLSEGWLISKERKGTFVADVLPKANKRKIIASNDNGTQQKAVKNSIVFDDGLPDSRLAPMKELARAYRQIFNRKSRWQMMGYGDELGDLDFRTAIMQMLNFKRGMNIEASEICITRGSQMAMYLTAHCLLEKGDSVLIENPGYKPAWQAFESTGANLLPVSVDNEGVNIEEIEHYLKTNKRIKAIYTTPHHQFPTTVTMSLQRRLKLVALSNKYGFTIIEDDYDNEFHFAHRPIFPISSFENAHNFIYIGTLSKIVAPALRIGFLVSNNSFINKVGNLRKLIDVQGDNIMEQAVLQLINDGEVKRHLKRTSAIYKAKRDYFETLLNEHLSDKVTFTKPDGGLAFWLIPKTEMDIFKIAEKLQQQGIGLMTPDKFSFNAPINGFRLGYASLSEKQLEEGIVAISRLL